MRQCRSMRMRAPRATAPSAIACGRPDMPGINEKRRPFPPAAVQEAALPAVSRRATSIANSMPWAVRKLGAVIEDHTIDPTCRHSSADAPPLVQYRYPDAAARQSLGAGQPRDAAPNDRCRIDFVLHDVRANPLLKRGRSLPGQSTRQGIMDEPAYPKTPWCLSQDSHATSLHLLLGLPTSIYY
jgi:hypothetical protein